MTAGMMITGGQVGALLLAFLSDLFLKKDPTSKPAIQASIYLMVAFNAIAVVASLLAKEDLRRIRNDAKNKLVDQPI